MKAHEAVIELFDERGIDTVFALMSEDTMGTLAKMEEQWREQIRVVHSRHEQSAVAMADGYSRATSEIGACLVGRGPAIAQTGTSLVTARKNGSRVLVLVPTSKTTATYDSKSFDQESYLESTVGSVKSVRSSETLLPTLREAFRLLAVGEGPVVVQVPWNVLDGDLPDSVFESESRLDRSASSGAADAATSSARLNPDPDAIDEAIERYLDSDATKAPMIVAGRGAIASDAKAAIEELAERTNALLATTLRARGYFDEHPFSLGFVGDFGSNIANEHLAGSDFVLALGCSLNPWTTDSGHLVDDATVVHIDADPAAFDRYIRADVGVLGDVRLAVSALIEELERLDIDRQGAFWTDALRTKIEETPKLDEGEFASHPDRIDPRDLVRGIDRLVRDDRLLVLDGGHFCRWSLDGISTPEPGDMIWTLDFSAIGQGLSAGIGAASALEDRTCVTVCGDAGFMMALQELDTAVRHDVPMLIVVMNDSALGTEYHGLLTSNRYADVALIDSPDVAEVARSLGAEGYTVRSTDDLTDLRDVLGRRPDGPIVVDCKIDREVRHRSKM